VEEKILVIEDDDSVRNVLVQFLDLLGYDVVSVGNEKDAEKVFSSEFDIVITDLYLKGTTGIEIVNSLRKKNPTVRVLYMTGSDCPPTGKYELCISKPFESSILVENLERLMKL
jgi:DNA-binding NtrC family response regulator